MTKKILTDEQIGALYIEFAAGISHATKRELAFARAIERAVLEAAPASTAVAMIDAALAEASDYHDLRARLITLLAAPASSAMAQAVDEWLPIDSAPKDGTFVLLGSKEGAWVARYQPVYQSGYKPENPWQSMMLSHDHMPRHDRSKPTYWKPLTAPVRASDAGRQ